MFKKIMAALGITALIVWITKKRNRGDEFEFSDPADQ